MSTDSEHLNIAFVFDGKYAVADGVPNYMRTLGDYFEDCGHDVSFVVGESAVQDSRVYDIGRVATVPSNGNQVSFAIPSSGRDIKDALTEIQPDILHVQMPYNPFLGARLIKAANQETAIVGTFHILPNSKWIDLGTRALGLMLRPTLKRFDQIVSVSEPAKQFCESTFKVESAVLPCPVDINKFQKGNRLPEYDDGKTNIVFMGRLVERKGCQHLIAALSQLDSHNLADIRVLIAGKGDMGPELVKQVEIAGLTDIVKFLGFVAEDDKPDLLASADIAVFPATGGESFGIVLTEAMAAGAGVVVGGNNPGYSSVLKDTPEVIVDPKLTNSSASLLSSLIESKQMRQDLHTRQQETVQQYDISVVGQEWLQIYKQALSKK